jgi:DNA-binding beta-propeller fold protein YncE
MIRNFLPITTAQNLNPKSGESMKTPLQHKLSFPLFFSLFIFLSVALPVKADVLVIAYMNESKVVLVDGKTYKTLVTLDSGKNPHEVRVSPDERLAYVAAGKTITVVDLKNRKVRANFDLGEYSAHDIRVSRDNRRLWLACAGKEAILELDAETGKILNIYNTKQKGAWFVEITPDERKIYTPNLEGKSVSVITRATNETKIIPFEHPVYGIDITPDGKQVWVTGRDITVIDTATEKIIAAIKTPEADTGRIRLTSDGKRAVIALLNKVLVYDVKTRRLVSEVEVGANPKVLTLSDDNRRAFLTNPNENSVTVVNIIKGKKTLEFKTGKKPDGIGWAN